LGEKKKRKKKNWGDGPVYATWGGNRTFFNTKASVKTEDRLIKSKGGGMCESKLKEWRKKG
jgi:hypothetical protein